VFLAPFTLNRVHRFDGARPLIDTPFAEVPVSQLGGCPGGLALFSSHLLRSASSVVLSQPCQG